MTTNAIKHSSHYITFRLGDELFAIDVIQVREVLDRTQITRVPTAPSYVRGVVNVRGAAIPVVDLRLKFGLPALTDSVNTRIIVLEVMLDGEKVIVGGLADSVHDVIALDPQQIDEAPRIAMRWRSELIKGMGKQGGEFIIILDINRVFSSDEVALVAAKAHTESAEL